MNKPLTKDDEMIPCRFCREKPQVKDYVCEDCWRPKEGVE